MWRHSWLFYFVPLCVAAQQSLSQHPDVPVSKQGSCRYLAKAFCAHCPLHRGRLARRTVLGSLYTLCTPRIQTQDTKIETYHTLSYCDNVLQNSRSTIWEFLFILFMVHEKLSDYHIKLKVNHNRTINQSPAQTLCFHINKLHLSLLFFTAQGNKTRTQQTLGNKPDSTTSFKSSLSHKKSAETEKVTLFYEVKKKWVFFCFFKCKSGSTL